MACHCIEVLPHLLWKAKERALTTPSRDSGGGANDRALHHASLDLGDPASEL